MTEHDRAGSIARDVLEQSSLRMPGKVYWLIECSSQPNYYCDPGEWCNNPMHARRYPSKRDAETQIASLTTSEPATATEHVDPWASN